MTCVTTRSWHCSEGFTRSRSRPVVEVAVVGAARAGVARDGAEGLRVIGILLGGGGAAVKLRQGEIAGYVAVGWRESYCSASATELEIGEHPAFAVCQFGYFICSCCAAAVVCDSADGAGVAACEFWEGLALC